MTTGQNLDRVTVPIAEETATVHKTSRTTSGVRVRKTVQEDLQDIDETVKAQSVTVERIPIGRWIDRPIPERQEGDTTVISIIEEVAVVEKRLRLVEEIRVTRTNTTQHFRAAVPVRRETAIVENMNADGRFVPLEKSDPEKSRAAERQADRNSRSTHMQMIIGFFTDPNASSQAQKALLKAGGKDLDLEIFSGSSGDSAEKLRQTLAELDIEDKDIEALAGSLAKGAVILAVTVEEDRADSIITALTQNGAEGTDTYDLEEAGSKKTGSKQTLPEVEEHMQVTKKGVSSGVRAQTKVTETPVERTVNLKQEKVEARHRDANRELSADEADEAFQDKTVEVTGVSEEAEIRKAARLIGEVEITKSSEERQETIRDTVRKSEVETEKTGRRS